MSFVQGYHNVPTGGPQPIRDALTHPEERDPTTNNEVLPPDWANQTEVLRNIIHYRASQSFQFMINIILPRGKLPPGMKIQFKTLEFLPNFAEQETYGSISPMGRHRMTEFVATGNVIGTSFTLPTARLTRREGIDMYNGSMGTLIDAVIFSLVRNAYLAIESSPGKSPASQATYFGRRPAQEPVYLRDLFDDRNRTFAAFSKDSRAIQTLVDWAKTTMNTGLRGAKPNVLVIPYGTRAFIRRSDINMKFSETGNLAIAQRLQPFVDHFIGNLELDIYESQPFPHEELQSQDILSRIVMKGDRVDLLPRVEINNFNTECNEWDIMDEDNDVVATLKRDSKLLDACGLWGWDAQGSRLPDEDGVKGVDRPSGHRALVDFFKGTTNVYDYAAKFGWENKMYNTAMAGIARSPNVAASLASLFRLGASSEENVVEMIKNLKRHLSELENTKANYKALWDANVQTPLRFLAVRPFKKYETVSAFAIEASPATGQTLIGDQTFDAERSARDRNLHVHYTVEQLVVLKDPKKVQVLYDVVAKRQIKGNAGVGFFMPWVDSEKRIEANPDKSIIIIPVQLDEKIPDEAIDITGKFHADIIELLSQEGRTELNMYQSAHDERQHETHYSTADFIKDAYGFSEATPFYNMGFERQTMNTICEKASQLGVGPGPDNLKRRNIILGTDCWGGNIQNQARKVRFTTGRFVMPDVSTMIPILQGTKA